MSLRFFDPHADYDVTWRRLPHWQQDGTICFITWRTADSIPKKVLARLERERNAWLIRHEIDPATDDWQACVKKLPTSTQAQFRNDVSERWNAQLDQCHGECVLRRSDLAKIVADSLLHFDNERYLMGDFVVMPNHVHLLASIVSGDSMLRQCRSWKRYTATQINRELGRTGEIWQEDCFDRLVRSAEQLEYFTKYIADNPRCAGISDGEFFHYPKWLGRLTTN